MITRSPWSFGEFVAQARAAGQIVVQPRMGFSHPQTMHAGLTAVRHASATTVGTITVDSYTRVNDLTAADKALAAGVALNGYPIATYPAELTQQVIGEAGTPVQVRHGSARPEHIIRALTAAGLHATEGGPISYCLPYSRVPVRESVHEWERSTELLVELCRGNGQEAHLETFGGCMMGQLCPPGLLVALSTLEALFFRQHGLRSISLSYAQQTHAEQNTEAVLAMRRLIAELLPDVQSHVVVYAYMGVYPLTGDGATRLLQEAARLTARTGAARLIVKTTAEAFRIPTIAENVIALETAAAAAGPTATPDPYVDSETYAEARALVDAVLDLDDDIGAALISALQRGYLDIPYCLHPDNAGRATGQVGGDGRLRWTRTGSMPIRPTGPTGRRTTAPDLLESLNYIRRTYDSQQYAVAVGHQEPR
ncbi:methylaspartate mutase [Kribbella sp. NBC_00382]|uniref:methylaspartate mutase n=1 Tax=Kribbella sp. NBC_00382 TaxID=2975967 RepID=UPI002E21EA06